MSSSKAAVFGIYATRAAAGAAVDALRAEGFHNTDVSVLYPQSARSNAFGQAGDVAAREGAVTGGGAGAVIGGSVGWLAGIGMLALPGVGSFVAAGPIMAALATNGARGATRGMAGVLMGMEIPEDQARRYEGRIRTGAVLLSVHADTRERGRMGMDVLERTGADEMSSTERAGDAAIWRDRRGTTGRPDECHPGPPG
jgi:hypothetical protein